MVQNSSQPEKDKVWGEFKPARECGLSPYFARRLQRRLKGGEAVDGESFDMLLDFWSDNGAACDTIANERQHTDFNKLLFSARRHVGSQKVGDVVRSHFTRAIRRDHSKRFGIKAKKSSFKKNMDAVKIT